MHDRFQRDSTYRDSQLKIGWTVDKCIEMDKLAQEDYSFCPSSEEHERYKKNWCISLNKSGRNAPMKLRSDFREAVTIMNRLHRESGEEGPEPILFINTKGGIRLLLPVPHGGSGMNTGGAHNNILLKQDRLQLMAICCNRRGCEQNTLTRHIFSYLSALMILSHTTLAQVFVRVIPSMFHVLECLTSLRLSTLHSSQSLSSST